MTNSSLQSNCPIVSEFFNYVAYQTNHVMFNEPFGVSESMWYMRNEEVIVQQSFQFHIYYLGLLS